MENKVKAKLEIGEAVIGTFFEMGSSTAVESLGLTGLDFFIIDTEHGPFDVESTLDFIRAAELKELTPFVRIKDRSRSSILKMLDIGAKGLIIPFIKTADDAAEIVKYGKYFPLGERGFFFGRPVSYGYEDTVNDLSSYFNICNRETMLIPQCETRECLENIEEISSLEGIDGIFVGPYDLSIGMGKPAVFDDPDFKAALERILEACRKAGKPAFIYCGDAEAAKKYISMGFKGVGIGTDNTVYINAYKSIVKEVRS